MFGRRQTIKAARRADAAGTISLAKLRVWYTQNDGQQQGGGGSSDGTKNTGIMIPKDRLDEVIRERDDAREKLQTHLTTAQLAEQERLKEQGRYKELAETNAAEAAKLKPYQERAQTLEKRMADANKARIERVPEALRGRIPAKLSTEDLSDYLDANMDWLTGTPAPDIDAGAGGAGGSVASAALTADEKRTAKAAGMTDAEWVAAKNKAAGS